MKSSRKLLLVLLLALPVLTTSVNCEAQAPAQAAEAQAAQERWIAVVTSAQGGVYVQHPGQTHWETLKVADKCYPGDSIRVEENSRAALLFKNDSTLRIDQNTTLTFQPTEEQTIIMRILNGAACFFSRVPRSLKIFTPHMNGTVKGTEFVIRVDGNASQINLFDGQVLAENDKGELLISKGQSVVARAGQAPVSVTVVRPRDAVQWALYYPAIMDFRPEDFPGGSDWQDKVRQSIEAYRKGDLAGANNGLKGIKDEGVTDTRYLLYRASLALSVGRVDEASAWLDKTLTADPKNASAYALQSIIATAQNSKAAAMDLASRAVSFDPQSPTARIALSYTQQARFDIRGAMASIQEAVKLDPSDAYARARLAELWLAQGYLNKALEEAQRAASINPSLARTQAVLGYSFLTQVKIAESKDAFEKAIRLDSADPLARLGLGLAKIRKGDLTGGRQEIEVAASLDPNNSIIRSYLGKAYYEEKRDSLSASQLGIAKQLDPMDPTPWFYDAILKQSVNRPVEALQDIQKSIELNDNRAIYRSKLLMDSDLAARSASQARIYNDLGFQQLALVEGWKSVNADPTNYSAHRFLADSYSAVPRRQIAKVSELLQSQLLQPLNLSPIQPQLAESNLKILEGSGPSSLSFNEYNPLFVRNGVALQADGVWGQKNTLGNDLAISGLWDRFSFSMGQFYYQTDGFRQNNDQMKSIYNVFTQGMLTYATSVQAEYRYKDDKYGDLPLRFDPNAFFSDIRYHDQPTSIRVGVRHSFTPQSDLLVSFSYQRGFNDVTVPVWAFSGKQDGYMGEAQYLFRSDQFNLIGGAGFVDLMNDDQWNFFGTDPFNVNSYINHYNLYLYTLTQIPRNVTWVLGASVDWYHATDYVDTNQVNPKFGIIWNLTPDTTLRAAAFRTFKRTLLANATLEPTQVAGFNQFFDDFDGTDAWYYGVAFDQKILKNLFGGLEASMRDMSVPYMPAVGAVAYAGWREKMGRAYLFWTPHPYFSLGAEYLYERFDRDDVNTGNEAITNLTTNSFPLGVSFFHPMGIYAQLKGTYVYQKGDFFDPVSGQYPTDSSSFWVFNAALGYRFPKRFGTLELGVKNATNENFRYQDTNPAAPTIYPERYYYGRLSLSF